MQKVRFANDHKLFTAALKSKVNNYFAQNNLKPVGDFRLYIKTIVFITLAVSCYAVLMIDVLPNWAALLTCALLGISFAGIGFNIMHDGGHNSYSNKKWVNELMAYSLNLLGGNIYLWKIKHNYNHHSFTNIDGIDEDIDIRPFLRTGNDQPLHRYHRYQHIYWVVLYGMVYFAWIYIKDFKKYFGGRIADTQFRKMSRGEHFIFWISKLLYLGIFIALPSLRLGLLPVLTGYAVMSVVCGFILGIVFQMAHVTEGTSVHSTQKGKASDMSDWFVHQLQTTANFSTKSKFVSWFAGGLNFQVEHHLFPQISHVHYPAINLLVKDTCKEYNIRYSEYPTFLAAVKSHVEYLKTVGRQ